MLYKLSWVAKESRPEAAGASSILASKVGSATVGDMADLNAVIGHLRTTATRPLVIWKYHPDRMSFITASDAGGIGSPAEDPDGMANDATQGAWILLTTDQIPDASHPEVRVSPLAWRSARLKRRVPSTLAGETLALSQAVAEVEWMQLLYADALRGTLRRTSWEASLSPYVALMRENCALASYAPQGHVVDAKSVYDAVLKGAPGSRQDRRSAIELAIIVEACDRAKSYLRWVPHALMPVDALTKANPLKGAAALEALLSTGILRTVVVEKELRDRKDDQARKSRSVTASRRRCDAPLQQPPGLEDHALAN